MLLTNFIDPFKTSRKSICISRGYVGETDQPCSIQNITDCRNYTLLPGLIDLQVYGAGGHIFEENISVECLRNISSILLQHGTTGFLITLPSTSLEKIFLALEIVRETMLQADTGLLGLHLEGPFIHPHKKGAHNADYIIKPEKEFIEEILARSHGAVKMITIAPEIFSEDLLDTLIHSGIEVSLGHSTASYEEAQYAFDKGVKCCTHLYNAMSQLGSREPGLAGAALLNEEVWATIVVDGTHVCYKTLELTFRLKKQKLMLISDATFLDVKAEESTIAGIKVYRKDNRFYTLEGNLAGSNISLMEAIKNCVDHLNIPLNLAVEMASQRPADFLGLKNKGSLQVGNVADLILINDEYQISGIMVQGKWIKQP